MSNAVSSQPQQYGIKIAQPGYNVKNCADYQLIFNSSWPSLAIAYDVTMAITTDQYGNAKVAHGLGFTPLAMAWQFSNSTYTLSQGRVFPSVDSTYCYFPEASPNTTYYYNLKCYNLDITQQFNYPYLEPSATNLPYDKTYGIKVSKAHQSIASTDMRSYILHSRCASPQVLAVVTQATGYNASTGIGNNNNVLTYTNPKGYTAWAFGYAQVNNLFTNSPVYQWAPPVSQSYPILQFQGGNYSSTVNPGLVTMQVISYAGGTAKGSIIILRDPLFAPNSVSVTY